MCATETEAQTQTHTHSHVPHKNKTYTHTNKPPPLWFEWYLKLHHFNTVWISIPCHFTQEYAKMYVGLEQFTNRIYLSLVDISFGLLLFQIFWNFSGTRSVLWYKRWMVSLFWANVVRTFLSHSTMERSLCLHFHVRIHCVHGYGGCFGCWFFFLQTFSLCA